MWRVWGRRGGCIGSWWGNWREREHWGDLGVDVWIILGWISRRCDVGIWTGLGWPRIEFQLASQEGLCTMEYVSKEKFQITYTYYIYNAKEN